MDITKEWMYDSIYKCKDCEFQFAVLMPEETSIHFCPSCASRNLDSVD